MTSAGPSFVKTPLGWACLALAVIGVLFLATGHATHVLGVLAWLAILACPLVHLFLHRHHRRRGHDEAVPPPRRK